MYLLRYATEDYYGRELLPLEVFAYFIFTYIVRQVSDPKMASLPNHYVSNSSSFGNTPKHTGRRNTIPPRSNGFRQPHKHGEHDTHKLNHSHTENGGEFMYFTQASRQNTNAHFRLTHCQRDGNGDTMYDSHARTSPYTRRRV